MPAHKRQHYVPRCYLKPFSRNGEGSAINVHNITHNLAIQNAAVKGQCAKDYLYGENLELEHALQFFEDDYARILRIIQGAPNELRQQDLYMLRGFALLQYVRTDMAIQRMREMHEGMHNAVYRGRPTRPPDIDVSERTMMLQSMRMYTEMRDKIEDLKVCIVKNNTSLDFVTSDDPAIFTSRFHIQRRGEQNFGLGSSGAVFFLPLTPRFLMMSYDADVYTVPGKTGSYVSTTKQQDVFALNELQYLKAAENIYFSRWDERNNVEQAFCETRPHRPDSWCQISTYIPHGITENREQYRVATEMERTTARETLISISPLHPAPSRWLSKLRFRSNIKTYGNGSVAGHVRKGIWENRRM